MGSVLMLFIVGVVLFALATVGVLEPAKVLQVIAVALMGVGYVLDVTVLSREVRRLRTELDAVRGRVNAMSLTLSTFRSEVEGLGARLSTFELLKPVLESIPQKYIPQKPQAPRGQQQET